ncbi:hypothetical protein PCO82_09280 [Pectobacteriaceae bacterium CE90]|nr:hypothetical protein [Prodigiosinella sp. LS101]WJV52772.1 hypothetical protein PCO85_16325 [Prodigiosinella sp. LS101]WJV57126.1 hypothetical protein PCO84_16305 [Pectobacteriaceae bacterium C111]WJY16793.1 hypothetical protein PCO82_09280 [Pectobacteriaceae bacterium CE90]
MKPSTLRAGQRVLITPLTPSGNTLNGTFIRRVKRQPGHPAHSIIRVDEFVGLRGTDDLGDTPYSDYDAARRFLILEA